MNRETTRIDLPPPRMIQPREPSPWLWVLLVFVALAVGTGAGLYFGSKRGEEAKTAEVAEMAKNRKVAEKVAEARIAVAEGDWFQARRIFEEVRELDPENPNALASLPLIDRRLDEARGSLQVVTKPDGARVTVDGVGEFMSPALITRLPFGEHELVISKDGFESVTKKIMVQSEDPIKLDSITLGQSAGQLEVVSEPKADFRIIKTIENDQKQLVKVGSTPIKIDHLESGEYEVRLAVEGWPEYSEKVRVENNRHTSVSAVFAKGGLKITSDPIGAEVWFQAADTNEDATKVGATPINLSDLPVGKHRIELRYEDWEPISRTVEVVDGVTEDLDFSWERALVSFESTPPGAAVFADGKRIGSGNETTPFRAELPQGNYIFRAQHEKLGAVQQSSRVESDAGSNAVSFSFAFGNVNLTSEPSGATVLSNGVPIGRTPLSLPVVPPGAYSWRLKKEHYRDGTISGTVSAGSKINFGAALTYDPAPVTSRSFKNGIGQELSWVGTMGGWVAAHETTQAQYERVAGKNPSYFKKPDHPVESVTWYDATRFCEALTVLEKGLGNIPEGYRYRLPTDAEWSKFVGNQKLDAAISSLFDRKKSTAAVGTLASNEYGLYDVRGNVWEWVSDWYSQTIVTRVRREGSTPVMEWVGTDRKVLRGGGWTRSSQYDLAIANRMGARPSSDDRYDVGFRVVLMKD